MTASERIDHADFVAWCAEGHKDAHGQPMRDWLLCRVDSEGKPLRDADGHQVYETQAEWLARNGMPSAAPSAPTQQDMFG